MRLLLVVFVLAFCSGSASPQTPPAIEQLPTVAYEPFYKTGTMTTAEIIMSSKLLSGCVSLLDRLLPDDKQDAPDERLVRVYARVAIVQRCFRDRAIDLAAENSSMQRFARIHIRADITR